MYLFIATIFIAELIIAAALISLFVNCDKQALKYSAQIVSANTAIKSTIVEVREILISAQNIMDRAVDYIHNKKKEFRSKLINLALIYVILILFKTKYKRAATIFQYLLLAKDFWNSIPV